MIESHDSTGEFNKPTYLNKLHHLESEKFTGICLPNRLDHHSLLENVCPNPPVLPSSHSAHAKSQGLPQFPPRTPTWRCKTIWITHKTVVSASQKTGRPNKKITCEECSRTSQQNASNFFLTLKLLINHSQQENLNLCWWLSGFSAKMASNSMVQSHEIQLKKTVEVRIIK